MAVRVVLVLTAAIVVTRAFGLGESAVFAAIATANVASAAALTWLFVRTERRLRIAAPEVASERSRLARAPDLRV
jgi:ABC-type sulfate transport system permease subunit